MSQDNRNREWFGKFNRKQPPLRTDREPMRFDPDDPEQQVGGVIYSVGVHIFNRLGGGILLTGLFILFLVNLEQGDGLTSQETVSCVVVPLMVIIGLAFFWLFGRR